MFYVFISFDRVSDGPVDLAFATARCHLLHWSDSNIGVQEFDHINVIGLCHFVSIVDQVLGMRVLESLEEQVFTMLFLRWMWLEERLFAINSLFGNWEIIRILLLSIKEIEIAQRAFACLLCIPAQLASL